jgi:DNA-binding GntR family transcriptional regulator
MTTPRLSRNDQKALDELTTDTVRTVGQVAELTGLSKHSAREALNRLVRAKLARVYDLAGRGGPRGYTKVLP